MYAVIMAGGGGTRLHPLSRPERPKPFLPLLGDRVAAPGDGRSACAGSTDDITVVTDRRYERLVRDQLPDVARARSSRWAATRPRPSPSRRSPSTGPTTRSWSCCPADAYIDPSATRSSATSCGRRPSDLATGAFGIETRW